VNPEPDSSEGTDQHSVPFAFAASLPHPIISATSIVTSVLTLSIITFTAGMYPAQRAAEMAPVDSLRYE